MGKKSLAKNSIYNIIYKMLNIVFPLITSAYVARVLMAESIGKVAAAQNIASYFTLVAAMGIPTYGVKLIAQYAVKSEKLSKAFSELFLINLTFSIVCSILYYVFIFNFSYFGGKELLYGVAGVNVIFNVFNVDWFYQGVQEYGYIALRSFIIKCVSLFFLLVFVRDAGDYIFYALVSSGALVGNYIFNVLRLRKYVRLMISNLKFSEHLHHIFVLFIATVAVEIYVLADTTMLDFMCNSSVVGYYTMSMRIIKLVRSLVVAISTVFLPQLSYLYYNKQMSSFYKLANKGLHILMIMSLPAATGIFLIADDAIITFFGAGFLESIVTTRILSISIITVALSNFIGLQILVTIGKERITTISTVCGAIVNICLNVLLIRILQHNGAAIASVITEATVMAIQLVLSRKYIRLKFGLAKPIISVCAMTVVVMLVRQLRCGSLIRFLLACIIGAITYVISLILLRDEFALEILGKLKKFNV